MKIGKYNTHPAADCFPMHDQNRLDELAADINANGLWEPVVLCDGKVLDGRNRLKACFMIEVEPQFEDLDGDPIAYVRSMNAMRRDLSPEQRGIALVRLGDLMPRGRPKAEDSSGLSEQEIAADIGLHERNVRKLRRVDREAPEVADAIMNGAPISVDLAEKLAAQGKRERSKVLRKIEKEGMKPTHAVREVRREQLADQSVDLPEGTYRVIYADPPWQYGDSKAFEQADSSAAEGHYPTMPLADICALDVNSMAADNAVLFMWGTFPLLPDALQVIRAWGFKYKTAFIWDKQRTNMGNYHTADAELLFVATRGSCVPDAKRRKKQVQRVDRKGRHSAKPEHFRNMIQDMYSKGTRIELFRRGKPPKGWKVWGNETVS